MFGINDSKWKINAEHHSNSCGFIKYGWVERPVDWTLTKSNYTMKLHGIPEVARVMITLARILSVIQIKNNAYGKSKSIITVSKIQSNFPIKFTRSDTQHCLGNDNIMKSSFLDENKQLCLWK